MRVGLGTDVAGGASASMMDCMRNTLSASRAMGFRFRQDGIPPSMNELTTPEGGIESATSPYKYDAVSHSAYHECFYVHGCCVLGMYIASHDHHLRPIVLYSSHTICREIHVLFRPYRWLNTDEVFHLATQGGAEALGMGGVVGNFLVGKKLDCVVVDVDAEDSPIDTFGEESLYNLFEKFIYIGDDRNIAHVIVDGKVVDHN